MNKWLKRILVATASIVLLLVVLILALPFVIDPNSFKGPLQRAAAGQNVHLELQGPIAWQFYPQLGLSLEGVVIAPLDQPERPLAQAEAGTAAVALVPLFSRQVQVDEVVLNGVAIDLLVDEEGRGNWESLGKQDAQAEPEADTEQAAEGEALNVSVQRIAINNGSLSYEDRQSGQTASLRNLSIQLSDVNLDSRAFPLTVDATLSHSELANPVRLRFASQLQANSALDSFALENGQLQLGVDGVEVSAELAGQLKLQEEIAYQGRIAVEAFNLKALLNALGQELPPTADPAALTQLALAAQLGGTSAGFNSEQLSLSLDDTQLSGTMALALAETETPKLNLVLSGNSINLDRYLAPTSEEEEPTDEEPGSGDTPLPLDSLRAINAELVMSMTEIIMLEMPIGDPRLAVTGEDGLWQLTELSADFYQGKLQSEARLDARASQGDTAAMTFSARMDGLSVHPLLVDFAEFSDLSGTVDGELQGNTKGATSAQLINNLSAAFVFTSPQLTFQGINAEYFYCQMATRLSDSEMPDTEWPARTRITEVEGQLTFDNSRLTIASLVADVENLVLTSTGHLDLAEMDYRIRVPMRIAQPTSSPAGCRVESNFLQNREVDVLGCAGSLEAMDLGEQCGLDRGAITDLAQQAVRYNVKKRTDEKKEDIREDLKEKLREKLGEEGEEEEGSTRSLLRDLLNR